MSMNLLLAVDCYQDEMNPDFATAVSKLIEFKKNVPLIWHVSAQRMFGQVIYLPVISTAETQDQCISDMSEYAFSYFYGVYGAGMPTDEQLSELGSYCVHAIRSKIFGDVDDSDKYKDSVSHYSTLLFMILIGRIQPSISVNQNLKTIVVNIEI